MGQAHGSAAGGAPPRPPVRPLSSPTGVAVDEASGHVVVASSGEGKVKVFDAAGEVVRILGREGNAVGEFWVPRGVAVDKDSNIVVADNSRGNNRVQVFGPTGAVLGVFGDLDNPEGVAVTKEGHIVVVDSGNHRVQVFDSRAGKVVRTMGRKGHGVGELKYPQGVAVNGQGHIVVADGSNNRVQVFDAVGQVVRTYGKFAGGGTACGLAVDARDNIVVAVESLHGGTVQVSICHMQYF